MRICAVFLAIDLCWKGDEVNKHEGVKREKKWEVGFWKLLMLETNDAEP